MTGLSGSGKSSLAFDTIYADGQRRCGNRSKDPVLFAHAETSPLVSGAS